MACRADIKLFGNGVYIKGFGGNHMNDHPPGGIGYGLVYITTCFHNMQVSACKYKRKYSLAQNFKDLFLMKLLGVQLIF